MRWNILFSSSSLIISCTFFLLLFFEEGFLHISKGADACFLSPASLGRLLLRSGIYWKKKKKKHKGFQLPPFPPLFLIIIAGYSSRWRNWILGGENTFKIAVWTDRGSSIIKERVHLGLEGEKSLETTTFFIVLKLIIKYSLNISADCSEVFEPCQSNTVSILNVTCWCLDGAPSHHTVMPRGHFRPATTIASLTLYTWLSKLVNRTPRSSQGGFKGHYAWR